MTLSTTKPARAFVHKALEAVPHTVAQSVIGRDLAATADPTTKQHLLERTAQTLGKGGARDGARTRDLRRDRPAFLNIPHHKFQLQDRRFRVKIVKS